VSSNLDDIAAYIASPRAQYDRLLTSDLNRLKVEHGDRVVAEALRLSRENDTAVQDDGSGRGSQASASARGFSSGLGSGIHLTLSRL
jgi:hypothetical protein